MPPKKSTKSASKVSTLSKGDLIAELAADMGCDKKQAEKFLDCARAITLKHLVKGENVKFADMITLKPKHKESVKAESKMVAGNIRNITAKPAHISASCSIVGKFKKELLTKTAKK